MLEILEDSVIAVRSLDDDDDDEKLIEMILILLPYFIFDWSVPNIINNKLLEQTRDKMYLILLRVTMD